MVVLAKAAPTPNPAREPVAAAIDAEAGMPNGCGACGLLVIMLLMLESEADKLKCCCCCCWKLMGRRIDAG